MRLSSSVSIGVPAPNSRGPAPPSRRSLISRMRASKSRSMSANSSSDISPSSRCISAASSCSRNAVSSFISASAAVTTVRNVHEMPLIIKESRRNIALMLSGALQLQANVDKVVRRPWSRVLERQLVERGRDFLDAAVERRLLIALHEKCRGHDHLVPDSTVHARGDGNIAQPLQEFRDISLGTLLERTVDQPSVLHPGEIGGPLLRGNFRLQAMDVLVFLFDLANDLVTVPQHLETDFELVLHLRQHIGKRIVGGAQQLDDVFARLEDGPE